MTGSDEISRSMLGVGLNVKINPRNDRTRQKIVCGRIKVLLTYAETHPHGILVELDSGEIGRVKAIID